MGKQYKDSDYVHISDLSLLTTWFEGIIKLSYVRTLLKVPHPNEIQNTFVCTYEGIDTKVYLLYPIKIDILYRLHTFVVRMNECIFCTKEIPVKFPSFVPSAIRRYG